MEKSLRKMRTDAANLDGLVDAVGKLARVCIITPS